VNVATVNFSVPEAVKKAFDRAFRGKNKSAIIADLMRRAVDEHERRARRIELFRRLTDGRSKRPPVTTKKIESARAAGRT
jgi:hypothetical protein